MAIQTYPNSTQKGDYVPDSFINPISALILDYTTSAMGSPVTLWTTGAPTKIIQISSTTDCLLGFEATAVGPPTPGIETNKAYLLQGGLIYQIAMPDIYLSAVGLVAGGTLQINKLDSWNALALQVQYDRL